MSKRSSPPPRKMPSVQLKGRSRTRRRSATLIVIIALVLCLSLTGGLFAQWRGVNIGTQFKAFIAPVLQTTPSPANPSKEYIYVGGRLIATEEPTGTASPTPSPTPVPTPTPPPSAAAPGNLVATTVSGTQINLTWTAPASGTVDHYRIERSTSYGSPFVPLQASPTSMSFADTSVSAVTAYLYRVCAVDGAGNLSQYSNVDVATAITFTDDPLQAGVTWIKAQHLSELRQAVNAVRALAGLTPALWHYPDPMSNPPEQRRVVWLEDVTDLRTFLDEALTILGRQQAYPAYPPLGRNMSISKEHFAQIRDRVK